MSTDPKEVSDPIYELLSYHEKERLPSEIAYWLVRNDVEIVGHGELSEIVPKLLTSQQIERLTTGIADKKPRRPLTTQK